MSTYVSALVGRPGNEHELESGDLLAWWFARMADSIDPITQNLLNVFSVFQIHAYKLLSLLTPLVIESQSILSDKLFKIYLHRCNWF